MSETLEIGDLIFEVRRSTRRRTLGLTVDRNGELVVHAPCSAAQEELTSWTRTKLLWVHRKLALKEAAKPRARSQNMSRANLSPILEGIIDSHLSPTKKNHFALPERNFFFAEMQCRPTVILDNGTSPSASVGFNNGLICSARGRELQPLGSWYAT
jgi:predicted metal-dependent hydrolase